MHEREILHKFRKDKIKTIKELIPLLQCSAITVRRRLKKWGTYTSINQNGRYYVLPDVPEFDDNGLWKYQPALFSKHGNLRQTIIELIKKSDTGLSAADLSQVIEIPSSSSYFSQLSQIKEIKREKYQGRYVYFSAESIRYEQQKKELENQDIDAWPTDGQAIEILVHMIKNPGIELNRLAIEASPPGQCFAPVVIKRFLQFHGLLKKIPDSRQ